MVFKNIEIHNIAQVVTHDDGITWLRVPEDVMNGLDEGSGKGMCSNAMGVELRFVLKGESVKIKLASMSPVNSPNRYQIFYGGLQGGHECHSTDTHIGTESREITITRPANLRLLERMTEQAGCDWDPSVIRVIFTGGRFKICDVQGDVEPPRKEQLPKKTLLCYGSSITSGANSLSTPDKWTCMLAHDLNMDLINLGMSSSCRMEPSMVDYIASLGEKGQWDMATLELGINVLSMSEELFRERVENTLIQIAGRNPQKPVFVISPFYSEDDFDDLGRAAKWRSILRQYCEQSSYQNITYIDGLDILGDMSGISADGVHPNIYGVRQIALRLLDAIRLHQK